MTDVEHRRKLDAQRKSYSRKQRKKHGVCPECGKPLDDPHKTRCARCREISAKSSQHFRNKGKI